MTWRRLVCITLAATIFLPSPAMSATKCKQSDIRQIETAMKRLDAAARAFDNSKIKDMCRAGRRLVTELQRAERAIKSRPQCTLATSSDRRAFARVQRAIRGAERELKKAC
jgi:hypothetical protein